MEENQPTEKFGELPDFNNPDAVVAYVKEQYQQHVSALRALPKNDKLALKGYLTKSHDFLSHILDVVQRTSCNDDYDWSALGDILKIEKSRLRRVEAHIAELLKAQEHSRELTINARGEDTKQLGSLQPPLKAQFLLYLFLERKGREAAVGDALEDYSRNVKKFGKVRSDLLFYREVALSAWPFIKRVAKAGAIVLSVTWIHTLIGWVHSAMEFIRKLLH